jgi:gamma-butyrobetaine dioxygenase
LEVEWSSGHKSFYPNSFLHAYSNRDNFATFHKDLPVRLWDLKAINQAPNLWVSYPSLREPSGLLKATKQLAQYGLLFVSDVPHTEPHDDGCELPKLAEYFGDIRQTFYGRLFDVKSVRNSINIAYTDLDLGLHMDLL